MENWWTSMNFIEQVLTCIAIPATLILIIQTLMQLFGAVGAAADGGAEADTSGLEFDHGGVEIDHGLDGGFVHDGGGTSVSGPDTHDMLTHATVQNGPHVDHPHEAGMKIFTLRGIVAFLCVFGWSGLLMMRSGVQAVFAMVFAIAFGTAAMVLLAFIFAQLMKMQYNGTEDVRTAVGSGGTVYLAIPPMREGVGKVNVIVSGRYAEYEAVTDEKTEIEPFAEVNVIALSSDGKLVVIRK